MSGTALDDLALVISELTTNAVQHGTTGPVVVGLELRVGCLVVTVADSTPYLPFPAAAPADKGSERGRGLLLVEALTEEWGHRAAERGPAYGTAVWARYRLAADC